MDVERTVAMPQPFPNPTILRSKLCKLKVRISGQHFEQKLVIESASGKFYEIGATLKKAIFGQVVHGIVVERDATMVDSEPIFIRTNHEVAIKVFLKATLRQLQGRVQENPLMEITAMQYIGNNHPNIMGQLECCTDENHIYSIMNYVKGGELFDFIDGNGPMQDKQARLMMRQILGGLHRLHSLGIAHRDMSLENILYDGQLSYTIIDFGMCIRIPEDPSHPGKFCMINKQHICGKRNYIAPEVFREDRIFDPLLGDVWALGIILFISLTGVPPVDRASRDDDRFEMICKNMLKDMLQAWNMLDNINPLAVDLIQNILRSEPSERLTIDQIMEHPWMREE